MNTMKTTGTYESFHNWMDRKISNVMETDADYWATRMKQFRAASTGQKGMIKHIVPPPTKPTMPPPMQTKSPTMPR